MGLGSLISMALMSLASLVGAVAPSTSEPPAAPPAASATAADQCARANALLPSADGDHAAASVPDSSIADDNSSGRPALTGAALDRAEALFTDLAASDDAALKACGKNGLIEVELLRATLGDNAPAEQASQWWNGLLTDVAAPFALIAGGVVVALVLVLLLTKLLGSLPLWTPVDPRWAWAVIALAAPVAIVWHHLAAVDVPTLSAGASWALATAGLALSALLRWPKVAVPAAIGVSAGAATTGLIWIGALLQRSKVDWLGVALLGFVVVAYLVAGALAQSDRKRLVIDTFDDAEGKRGDEFAWILRERFLNLTTARPRGLEVVAGSDLTKSPVDQVAGLTGNAIVKGLVAVLQAITPTATYRVNGQIHRPADDAKKVESVTVHLRHAFGPTRLQNIPVKRFEVPGDTDADLNRSLATGAAAWLLFELRTPAGGSPARLPGGTDRWESLALQADAAPRSVSSALVLLARAVNLDEKNLAARYGQAMRAVDATPAPEADVGKAISPDDPQRLEQLRVHRWAIAQLDSLRTPTESGKPEPSLNPALAARITYGRAAIQLQLASLLLINGAASADLDEAQEAAATANASLDALLRASRLAKEGEAAQVAGALSTAAGLSAPIEHRGSWSRSGLSSVIERTSFGRNSATQSTR